MEKTHMTDIIEDINLVTSSKVFIDGIKSGKIRTNRILFATLLLEDSYTIITEPFIISRIEQKESCITLTMKYIETKGINKTTPQELFKDVLAVSLDESSANKIHNKLHQRHENDVGFCIEQYHEEVNSEKLDINLLMEVEYERLFGYKHKFLS